MNRPRPTLRLITALLALLAVGFLPLSAQDRLKSMPGYDQYQKMRSQIAGAVKSGALAVRWVDEDKALEYTWDGQRYRFDVASGKRTEIEGTAETGGGRFGGRGGGPARGRQFDSADSPDGRFKAFYRDRNLWISAADGTSERAVTTDGSEEGRIKYGTASWVYGEELNQNTAMWWSPDGSKLAFYRFDESPVPDYYLPLDQTKLQSSVDIEAYPKAGVDNPVVAIFVYDMATGQKVELDIRDGQPFSDDVVGHYAYHVDWTPDGSELTLNRTNRRQNIMEFVACNPATGACRVVIREEWPTGWVDNTPAMEYLADGKRFIWASERTGWQNFYLHDLSGNLLATLTDHPFEVANIVRVDEKAGQLWYMARSGDNHMKLQLHRVGLNGKNDRRLTDPAFHHTVNLSENGRYFVDVAQTHDQAPVTRLMDASGKVRAELATSDLTRFQQLGLQPVELFTFMAADGVTELHGMLHKPSNFDPGRKYPLLVSVYAGPATNGARETFSLPHPLTEYGFLVATIDSRSAAGRGKRFLDAIYQKLGTVEIDDQAAGVEALKARPYVNGNVGIFGTSYGGYASAMAIVRHPDTFQAAVAASAVTDWRHYDTIYTERYMWTPQGNTAGYDEGSVMHYANNLKGRLMIYYGTADNNVHPNNSMQLIRALQQAGKSFEVQVGPDQGHSGINQDRMMEFFIENLVLRPAGAGTTN